MNSAPAWTLLRAALLDATTLGRLGASDWDLLVRVARRADLLARLAAGARQAGVWPALPEAPRRHLEGAEVLALRQQRELRDEVHCLAEALRPIGVPLVLLKGAAYAMTGHPAAQGRMVSDVDILVPHERLADVETALMMAGWVSTHRDAYDQRYYRQWMHELPPMQHMRRGTVVDVHHTLIPRTARLRPDPRLLLDAARALPKTPHAGRPGDGLDVRVLSPLDWVLHSASHLMHEGDFALGLRGLVDLDALVRTGAEAPDFWPALLERAARLDLVPPLFDALRYGQRLLAIPVPPAVMAGLQARLGRARRSAWRQALMDACFERALKPDHALCSDRWSPLARGLLYLRGHWLRMPPHLLLWHLLRKAVRPKPGAAA